MLGANIENINSRSEVIDNNIADINTSLEQKKSIYKEKEEKVSDVAKVETIDVEAGAVNDKKHKEIE